MNLKFWQRLRSLGQRRAMKQEIDEELRFHLEQRTAENIAAGMSPEEAARAARKRFGNVQTVREECRETRWTSFGETTLQDVRFGLRMLRKNPGFTATAVLTLALGIGFVTTLFTMINGVAFGRLPFEDAQRIVSIDVPAGQFDEFAARQQSCETLSFVQPLTANLRAGTFVSRYPGAIVAANFLDVLRVQPIVGRGFLQEDALAGATQTALISHTIWEREFEQTADISGREIRINGDTYTIVGVMPDGFGFPFHQEIWMARRAAEPIPGGLVFGRLRPEVSIRRAADQFTALARSLTVAGQEAAPFVWDAAKPAPADVGARRIVEVVPFAERSIKQSLRIMLSAILAATFLVLLLACANVANLVLAR
ncbi:MAG: ABC transporter permease, partial [Akkermansiaceae bacterium]|nr:ABC transporter permease [Verrucomicrobiales bacterium]